jgi:hypothetical protein
VFQVIVLMLIIVLSRVRLRKRQVMDESQAAAS